MFRPERQTQVASEFATSVTHTGRVEGFTVVVPAVNHGAREFRIVRPRASIEVIRTDGGPHVIDYADLGVDVNRCSCFVLQVVDAHARTPRGLDHRQGSGLGEATRRSGEAPVPVRKTRNHCDELECRLLSQYNSEDLDDLDRPEVLIFDV